MTVDSGTIVVSAMVIVACVSAAFLGKGLSRRKGLYVPELEEWFLRPDQSKKTKFMIIGGLCGIILALIGVVISDEILFP